MNFSDNQAAFTLKSEKGPGVFIVSKLIEGNYPNYRQVIPGEMKERVALPREEFLHAPAPRGNHDQRQAELGQDGLRQKPACHHRELP